MAQDYRLLVKELRSRDTGHQYDNVGDATLVRGFQRKHPGKYDDFAVPPGADDTPPSRRPIPRGAVGQAWDFATALPAGVMRGGGKLIRDIEATTPQAFKQLPGGDLNLGQGILGASDYVAGTPGLATGQVQREPSLGSKAGSLIGETAFNLLPYMGATKVARAAYAAPTVAKAVMQSGATQGLTTMVRRALEQGAEPPPPPGVEPQRGPVAAGVIDTLAGAGSEVVGALGGRYGTAARVMGDAAIGALAAPSGQRGEGALFQGGLRALIGRTPIHVPGAAGAAGAGAVPPGGGGTGTPPGAPPATPPSAPPGAPPATPPAAARPSPAVNPNAYTPVEWAFYPEQRPTMSSFGVGVSDQPAPVTSTTPPAVATPQGLMEGFYPPVVKRPVPGRPINVQDFYGTGPRPDPNRTVTKPGEGVTELDLPEFQPGGGGETPYTQPGGRPLPGPTGPERQPVLYDVPEGPLPRPAGTPPPAATPPPAPALPQPAPDLGAALGQVEPGEGSRYQTPLLPSWSQAEDAGSAFYKPQALPPHLRYPFATWTAGQVGGQPAEVSPTMAQESLDLAGQQVQPTIPNVRDTFGGSPINEGGLQDLYNRQNAPPTHEIPPFQSATPGIGREGPGTLGDVGREGTRTSPYGVPGWAPDLPMGPTTGAALGLRTPWKSAQESQQAIQRAREGTLGRPWRSQADAGIDTGTVHDAFKPMPGGEELVTNQPPTRGTAGEARSPEEMIISEVDRAPEQRTAEPPTASISSTNPSLDIPPKPTTRPQSRMVDETPAPDVPPVIAAPDTGGGQPPVLTPPPPPDLPPPPPPTRGRGARRGARPKVELTPEEIAALGGGAAPLVPGKGGRVKKK